MDQKSFSVLLSFVQSWPLLGALISGVVASAANPAIAQRSRAIPTTIFLMAHPFGNADPAESLPRFYQKSFACNRVMRAIRSSAFGKQSCGGRRRRHGRAGGLHLSGTRRPDRYPFREAPLPRRPRRYPSPPRLSFQPRSACVLQRRRRVEGAGRAGNPGPRRRSEGAWNCALWTATLPVARRHFLHVGFGTPELCRQARGFQTALAHPPVEKTGAVRRDVGAPVVGSVRHPPART